MNMKRHFIFAFAVVLSVLGGEATISQDMVRLDKMCQGYYLNPQPDTVPEMLCLFDGMAKTYTKDELSGIEAPVIGFFSEIFRANPDKLDEWDKVIDRLSSKPLKNYLWGALCYANTDAALKVFKRHAGLENSFLTKRYGGGVTPILKWKLEQLSPGDLDACWGAFMASGNKEYVAKVMERALLIPEDNVVDLTTGAARWSLLANADSHPLVVEVMNELLNHASDDAFQYFTEAMAAKQRENLLTEGNRARMERLNVPVPNSADNASSASAPRENTPLPAKGRDVNYSTDARFKILYKKAKYQHTNSHRGNGRIVKGKLIVEGQETSLDGVASKAVFASDGLFVAPLYAGRTLRFVKHGYEPLDIELPKQLNGIPGPDLDLGEQTLHRLPEEMTVAVQFELKLPEGISQAQVELWTGELPSTWNDDGYDENARIAAFAAKTLQTDGKIVLSGLTPMPYELRIAAPGCMFCKKAFDASAEKDLGTIALQKIRTATFQMAKFNTSENQKEVDVSVDGETKLVIADTPDEFGQYDGFDLTYLDATHLRAHFIYWPNYFDDYGAMSFKEFRELNQKGALPAPKTIKGKTALEVGHFYRFRCDWRKADILLFFSKME